MGLEIASFIDDLNAAWPLADDGKSEGDDHLRNLKSCLQAQFPNLGSVVAVLPTAEELNYLVGVTANIQVQLDDAMQVAVGQRFLCRADVLPSNGFWSLYTGDTDRVPLIMNTLGVSAGGSWTISGLSSSAISTAGSSHTHTLTINSNTADVLASSGVGVSVADDTHSHSGTANTSGSSHSHNAPSISHSAGWRPRYREAVWLQYDG